MQSAERPMPVDHTFFEFGSIRYHVEASVSDHENVYLSISTPSLSLEASPSSNGWPEATLQEARKTYHRFAEVVEPPREGYVLTLKLNFSGLTRPKGTNSRTHSTYTLVVDPFWWWQQTHLCDLNCNRSHRRIAVVVSQRSREGHQPGVADSIVGAELAAQGRAGEPRLVRDDEARVQPKGALLRKQDGTYFFFKNKMNNLQRESNGRAKGDAFLHALQDEKINAVFPMRFRDDTDLAIATSFFQVGAAARLAFFSIALTLQSRPGVLPRHVRGKKRAAKTVWILLNFQAYVKYHIKCTRSHIQSRMRERLEALTEVIQGARLRGNDDTRRSQAKKRGSKSRLISLAKANKRLQKGFRAVLDKIKRLRLRIRVKGLDRLRRQCQCFPVPKLPGPSPRRKVHRYHKLGK
ncbi:hypothetical protein HU200_032509 [Digitaria exilis]|uniref:Arp2/3 complex 34 kDa subunit n=1 Tax=Digitaria exilis TaxID=1010633 RepID=A0A835BKX7_9POAL|nr:hypothetical protein HU200_032509 [Digitaria exilis]